MFFAEACSTLIPSLKESKGAVIEAVIILLTTLSVLAVILRLIARRLSSWDYGIDDILIVIALVRSPHRDYN